MKTDRSARLASVLLAAALALPLAACEMNTTREVETAEGTRVEREKTTFGVDENAKARAREAGRKVAETGREAGRRAQEGYEELRKRVPDVDVDVNVRRRGEPESKPEGGGTRR